MRIAEGFFVCAAHHAPAQVAQDNGGAFFVSGYFIRVIVTGVVDLNYQAQCRQREVQKESNAVLVPRELITVRNPERRDGVLECVLRRGTVVQPRPARRHNMHTTSLTCPPYGELIVLLSRV